MLHPKMGMMEGRTWKRSVAYSILIRQIDGSGAFHKIWGQADADQGDVFLHLQSSLTLFSYNALVTRVYQDWHHLIAGLCHNGYNFPGPLLNLDLRSRHISSLNVSTR